MDDIIIIAWSQMTMLGSLGKWFSNKKSEIQFGKKTLSCCLIESLHRLPIIKFGKIDLLYMEKHKRTNRTWNFANIAENQTNTNCSEGERRYCVLNRLHTQRNNFIVNNKISMLVGDGDDVGRRFLQPPESNPMRTKGQHIPKRRSLTPTVFLLHTNRHTT